MARMLRRSVPCVTVPIEYRERILLYVDVLGWSNLVAEAEKNPLKKELLARAIDFFISFHGWARIPGIARATQWQVALASDSLFASTPPSSEYLSDFLLETSRLARALLQEGIYLRGALVQGLVLHHKELIVGPAVVAAVELEEKMACFPRILIDDSALHHFRQAPQWVYRKDDGRASFNFIRHFADQAEMTRSTMTLEVDQLLRIVSARMDGNLNNPKVAALDRWMEAYLKDQLASYPNLGTDPGI
jgi:hypothetical protein